ncbi:hypothetical protein C8Q76DRAFT_789524 [Earliella scabrosa]|nr:hypothetical protein C8Q76DRAFT_789524 [Earliella scabrosa]
MPLGSETTNTIPTTSSAIVGVATAFLLILYGPVLFGTYQYFSQYRNDGYGLKTIIAALLVSDSVHTALATHVCFEAVITKTDEVANIAELLWVVQRRPRFLCLTRYELIVSHQLLTPAATIVITIFYIFFGRRVYTLCDSSWSFVAPAIAVSMSVIVLIALEMVDLWVDATSRAVLSFSDIQYLSRFGDVPLSSPAIVFTFELIALMWNIYLTSRMVIYLKHSRTGFPRTDYLLDTLIKYSINTGILTGIVTLAPAVVIMCSPTLAYYPLICMMPPVYALCVLAAVNSRRSLVDRGTAGIELTTFNLDFKPDRVHQTTIQWRDQGPDTLYTEVVVLNEPLVGNKANLQYQLQPAKSGEDPSTRSLQLDDGVV